MNGIEFRQKYCFIFFPTISGPMAAPQNSGPGSSPACTIFVPRTIAASLIVDGHSPDLDTGQIGTLVLIPLRGRVSVKFELK